MSTSEFRDPADSPRANQDPAYSEIEARDLLGCAVRAFPGNLPMARALFEQLVIRVCAEHVATALDEAGSTKSSFAAYSAEEIVARLITEVKKMPSPYLAFRCLSIVFSLPSGEGETQTDLALEFGVTKGDVSDICLKLCNAFEIEPGRGMKRPAARQSYADRQRGKRARPLPGRWHFSGMIRELKAA